MFTIYNQVLERFNNWCIIYKIVNNISNIIMYKDKYGSSRCSAFFLAVNRYTMLEFQPAVV